jgi:hypothetical protein
LADRRTLNRAFLREGPFLFVENLLKPAPLLDLAEDHLPGRDQADDAPTVILCSARGEERPHASWFGIADSEKAVAAAEQMGMHALAVAGDDLKAIAAQLPKGKIFASGKAFVPFVRAALFADLVRQIPKDNKAPKKHLRLVADTGDSKPEDKPAPAPRAKTPAPPAPDKPTRPEDWSKIKVGSLVLAREAVDEGWFEAIVTGTTSDGAFWLKWQDWPELDAIVRYRSQLALLYPSEVVTTASN